MKNLLFTLVLVFSLPLSVTLCGQTPNTFLLRGSHLLEVKENYKKDNPQARTWINALIKLADKDITQKPLSVVTKAKVLQVATYMIILAWLLIFGRIAQSQTICLISIKMDNTIQK